MKVAQSYKVPGEWLEDLSENPKLSRVVFCNPVDEMWMRALAADDIKIYATDLLDVGTYYVSNDCEVESEIRTGWTNDTLISNETTLFIDVKSIT